MDSIVRTASKIQWRPIVVVEWVGGFQLQEKVLDLKKLTRKVVVDHVKRHARAQLRLLGILRDACPSKFIMLDYEVQARPRYTPGSPHPLLFDLINSRREQYKAVLLSFLNFEAHFLRISQDASLLVPGNPQWRNGFIAGLDAVALYSLLAVNNPKRYFEIGSGYSTAFAKRAIQDHGLKTQITSLDPTPRSDIDALCDVRLRTALEDTDLRIFNELESGDILFVDGSHRVFTNSDVTVFFLEVLPFLKPGVLVQLHDIYLPYDYPADWSNRFYSERYLLAASILSRTKSFSVLLPNAFVTHDEELSKVLNPLWNHTSMMDVERYGSSFWIIKEPATTKHL